MLAIMAALIECVSLVRRGASGEEQEPDRPERVSIAYLLAQISPIERVPRGFLPRTSGTLFWQSLGPQPIANEYWSGNANAAGRASSIAVHPSDPNTAYVAAAGGGVWRTTDGGQSWVPISDRLPSLASGALAIDRLNPATVVYGTGEQHYSGDSFYGDGLFRTVDGGANWSKIALKSQVGNYIARVDISPGLLHVCSDFGYVSSDTDGASWAAFKPAGTAWCNDLVRSAQVPQTMFAAFYGRGIYKSIDNGQSWTQLAGGLPSSGFQRINLAIADSNADVVYASFIAPSGSLAGMYKTVNGGTSWSLLSSTPNYACSQGWYDNGMVVSPIDANTVYAGGVFSYCSGGIAKTTNGGTTWTYVTVGSDFTQVHPDQHYFVFGPDGALWVACDGGVWKTTTGGSSWVNLNNGLNTALLYTVGIHPSDPSFLVAGTQDNGTVQFQGGLAWPQVVGGDGGPVAVEWANPNRYFTTYVRLSPMYKMAAADFLPGERHRAVVRRPRELGERPADRRSKPAEHSACRHAPRLANDRQREQLDRNQRRPDHRRPPARVGHCSAGFEHHLQRQQRRPLLRDLQSRRELASAECGFARPPNDLRHHRQSSRSADRVPLGRPGVRRTAVSIVRRRPDLGRQNRQSGAGPTRDVAGDRLRHQHDLSGNRLRRVCHTRHRHDLGTGGIEPAQRRRVRRSRRRAQRVARRGHARSRDVASVAAAARAASTCDAVVAAEFASTGDAVAAAESSRAAISNAAAADPLTSGRRGRRVQTTACSISVRSKSACRPPVTRRV